MENDLILGIDPGVEGGIVVLSRSTQKIVDSRALDGLDVYDVFRAVEAFAEKYFPIHVFKEKYVARYSSPNAAFTIGRQNGVLDFAFQRLGLQSTEVGAREWQRVTHEQDLPDLKAKSLSLRAAKKYFADYDFHPLLKRGARAKNPHMGIVEAALIARFGLTLLKD